MSADPFDRDVSRRPSVAVVGVPNAGKSTLINRLSGTRTTVVHETPGVTRDRKSVAVEWNGREFDLIDTGGYDSGDEHPLAEGIRRQVLAAVEGADLVMFVVDARGGPLPGDHEIAEVLRRARTPVVLVGNKLDDPASSMRAVELFELGLGEPVVVSALHGTGTGDLLDAVVEHLESASVWAQQEVEMGPPPTPVAIVGRPNAGKSSLFNAIVGEPRTLVSALPGTTRDAIDTAVTTDEGSFRFVDTAGMRKAAKVSGVEYYAYLRSVQSLDRAHVAIVVADTTVGLGELDVQIAAEAARRGCATVLAFNKWDLEHPSLSDARGLVARKLRQRPSVLPVSAATGDGVAGLLLHVGSLERGYRSRVKTAVLNRLLKEISSLRPPPARNGRRLKAYYVTQYETAPPRFAIEVNDRRLVTRDYGYFIENQFRKVLGLEGVPVIIDFKTS